VIEYLSLEDLLSLVGDLGVGPIRDIGLLDSAAHRPQVSVLGEDAYPGVHEKAAVLLESIVRNHPLVDGNKRLGWLSTVVFYGLNGVTLRPGTTTPTISSSPSLPESPPTHNPRSHWSLACSAERTPQKNRP